MRIRLTSLLAALVAALVLVPSAWAAPTTFTVNDAGSSADASPGDGVCATGGSPVCTLRAAIEESSATASGAPYRIAFGVTSISVPENLPAITRTGTFVDGCGVDRAAPPFNTPNAPAGGACVGLAGTGATTGLQVGDAGSNPSGVAIYGLALTNFPGRAIRVWGADRTRIAGNLFGGLDEPNGTAIAVTGRTQNGVPANPATGTIIGGPSSATDATDPACDAYCNTIVNSAGAGIDLVGTASASGPGDAPAGGSGVDEGVSVQGNWIGVRTATGAGLPNGAAVKVGDAVDPTIGGPNADEGNVIAGNTKGVDQTGGTTGVTLLGGTYGISPDGDASVPNGLWNARLGGADTPGGGGFVQGVTFGPSAIGLDLVGPRANVIASVFRAPSGDPGRFTTAAIHVAPTAAKTHIGSNIATAFGCLIPFLDYCNTIGDTAPGAPGIWVDGASDARIWRNSIGFGLAAPLAGPPIRIDGGAVGADIGDNDGDPERRNILRRLTGPAIEVGEGATGIVIGDNEGHASSGFGLASGLFTDLLPDPGPGNAGTVNNGIQAPVVTLSSTTGIGGTGIPGATIHVLAQERPAVLADPDPYPEGYTFVPTPSVAKVGDDGIWGVTFKPQDNPAIKLGVKLLASQTTAAGSSEYAAPQAAAPDNPPPVVTITSGPSGVTASRSATLTFVANKPGSRFECSFDAGTYVACVSPFVANGIDIGGHQLRVRATDPIGKVGPPASRTWIVEVPEAPTPTPPATSSTAGTTLRFASLVTLPSAKACISKRSLKIRVRAPQGAKVKSADVRIGRRRVGYALGAKTIPVSLKGLPRGRFVVKVTVTLSNGRVIRGSRTYRTCTKKPKRR